MTTKPQILVTGASGFVGSALVATLRASGVAVRLAMRNVRALPPADVVHLDLRNVDAFPSEAFDGIDTVVHLAAIAHRRSTAGAIERINADAPVSLARAARTAGVRRFVFLSSIKALADSSSDAPLSENDGQRRLCRYGAAKRAAEIGLLSLSQIEVVCLRPPLVHAPRAKANFAMLLRLAASPLPIPLGGLRNMRSLISLRSLIDCLRGVTAPGGATGIFHVADSPAVSTSEIIAQLRKGMARDANLLPALAQTWRWGPFQQLYGSLAVNDAKFRAAFPSIAARDTRDELQRTARLWTNQSQAFAPT